ncbi:FAD binding domain protein [Ancylostoma ceylanicum]|uniref:Delta(24)-sterol reductase n=1 Tax=Ancylostoma ceylanicum TaxID=53326 RepID=A0A0D6LYA0_9BILA|nr:FAD binding domain protein [Ancylostoma ceylanicum]
MPLSTTYDILLTMRNKLIWALGTAPRAHGRKVAAIQSQVREWSTSGHGTKLYPVPSGWSDIFRRNPRKGFTPVCTGVLRDILEVDTGGLTVRVEPMVTMSQLSQTLIPLGYCLPIFPGKPGLTVQEAINSCGVDASGRKYGLFQHICLSFELVMPDGSVVVASKERHGDAETQALFYGVPWSKGTLGILVAATLRIIPVKPFVKVTYSPTHTIEEMQTKLTEECNCRENEFVEGLQMSSNAGVVLRGRFSEGPPKNFASAINRVGRWYQPWFYTHIEEIASTNKEFTEFIPLHDYYHRHIRHMYWEMRDLLPFANNFLFRWFLGWMSAPKKDILEAGGSSTGVHVPFQAVTPSLLSLRRRQNHVHQDLLVPMDHLPEILEVSDRETKIYPLWLCPYNQPSCPGMVRQRTGRNVLFVNVGVYGLANRLDFDSKLSTRRLEEAVRSVNGVRIMHGDTQMSRSEFWQMFDSSLYEWLRVKYNCKEAFVDVYDKVRQAVLC